MVLGFAQQGSDVMRAMTNRRGDSRINGIYVTVGIADGGCFSDEQARGNLAPEADQKETEAGQ